MSCFMFHTQRLRVSLVEIRLLKTALSIIPDLLHSQSFMLRTADPSFHLSVYRIQFMALLCSVASTE